MPMTNFAKLNKFDEAVELEMQYQEELSVYWADETAELHRSQADEQDTMHIALMEDIVLDRIFR